MNYELLKSAVRNYRIVEGMVVGWVKSKYCNKVKLAEELEISRMGIYNKCRFNTFTVTEIEFIIDRYWRHII